MVPARFPRGAARAPRARLAGASRHDGCVVAPPTSTDDDAASVPVAAPDDSAVDPAAVNDEIVVPDSRPWWRRIDPKLAIASLAIALGVVLIGYALARSETGDEAAHLPEAIEEITPPFAAIQVPQQATIIADLAAGYEGRLVIDDVTLPTVRQGSDGRYAADGDTQSTAVANIEDGEQLEVPPGARFEPGNATLTFTPGSDQAIEEFAEGIHTVTVVYWKTIEGERAARSYTWTFNIV